MPAASPRTINRDDMDEVAAALLGTLDAVAQELNPGRGAAPGLTLDSTLDGDIGLDSLARVEAAARLEKLFDVTLGEEEAFAAHTPRDLLRIVIRARAGAPLRLRAAPLQVTADSGTRPAKPARATTLIEMLDWHADTHPDRVHVRLYDDYTDGEAITYGALRERAAMVAGHLTRAGLLPGEAVAIMLPTGVDYFLVFFGALLAGGVPVPIYPPVRRQQLEDHLNRQRRILANCRATLLVTTGEAVAVARLLTAALSSLRTVVDVATLTAPASHEDLFSPAASDTAFLQYTSGSTGDPKGVVLSHANLLANIRADGDGMAAGPDDVFVSWLPLYHDMGLIGAWLGSLYHAVTFVVMPPLSFLARPERWLWAIHRYGGTLSAAPNFAYALCTERIDDASIEGLDLSRWRVAANGAEAISAETLDRFCTRFARYGFDRRAMFPVYGLAECSVGLAFPPLERGPLVETIDRARLGHEGIAHVVDDTAPDAMRIVACGQPLPGHEIRVVDGAGRELPERHEGRIEFRGPSATAGYFERPEATERLFDGDWLDSGDRGYIAAGDVYLTGRGKDIIIRAGRNIYPTELEEAVGKLDGVRTGRVAVFSSRRDDSDTEQLTVLAETRRRRAESREQLRTDINRLATAVVGGPADDIVLAPPNTVLTTSSGKIRRSACRELYEQDRIGQQQRNPTLQIARLALTGVLPQLQRLKRGLRHRLWATWALVVFIIAAVLAWGSAWVPLPGAGNWRVARSLARLVALLTATPVRFAGAAHLPAANTPCLLVSNHQSYLDGVLMIACLPYPVRFLIKGELGRLALTAVPLRRLGGVFVERFDARAGIAGMQAATDIASAGAALVVFAEGTFKRMPGLLPFHMGAFSAAADNGLPVVPIAIHGTRSVLRAGEWFPRRAPIALTVCPPVTAAATTDDASGWRAAIALRDATRSAILDHVNEPDLGHESNEVDS